MTVFCRRSLLMMSGLLGASALLRQPAWAKDAPVPLGRRLADLEHRRGGRLGVAILDMGNGAVLAHRGDERFAMCSTHKVLCAAFVLARVDRKEESLSRRVQYKRTDLVAYSPVAEKHLTTGLTIGELCAAALAFSDNTAANLLLNSFGGPGRLTAYIRSLGDEITRLDRHEPALNHVAPGDPRDTTTPHAMATDLAKLLLGKSLSAPGRAQLIAWMRACKTGDNRLRAGVPQNWRVADKTGSGPSAETNDIGIFWPPSRSPIVVAAYYAGPRASLEKREAVLAEVGRIAAST